MRSTGSQCKAKAVLKRVIRSRWARSDNRGSPDLTSPFKRGTDQSAHVRLIQGNASYFKDSLATRLAITVAGPGYVHFPLTEQTGLDHEFFAQLLSERKEKRKPLGVITTRWIQTRERNEALDLMVMCLCILEMFRGTLDTMQPVIADQTPKGHSADSIRGTEGHRQ